MKREMDSKQRSYIVLSHCHSIVEENDKSLEHMVDLLKDHVERYGFKKRISYNSCCNTFTSQKFDNDNQEHKSRSKKSIRYLMDVGSLDRKELGQFIVFNGWTDSKGRILYPGWNIPCLPEYDLKRRFGMVRDQFEIVKEPKMLEQKDEEEQLAKRNDLLQIQHGNEVVENLTNDSKIITPTKNRFFHKEQYHNKEYDKIKNSERKGEKGENRKVWKK